jgi:hypothetical protein
VINQTAAMIPAIQATDKVATPHPWGIDIFERFFIAGLIPEVYYAHSGPLVTK